VSQKSAGFCVSWGYNKYSQIYKKEVKTMKVTKYGLFITLLIFALLGTAFAGQFGAPESTAKGVGNGWQVSVGYWYHEDKMKDGGDTKFKQNEVYVQVAKSFSEMEIYARFGGTNAKSNDVFTSSSSSVKFAKDEWDSDWKPFGTLGLKGYYPFNKQVGIGAFVQGTYVFGDLEDSTTATVSGTNVAVSAKIKNLWEVDAGIAVQLTLPADVKLYAGPYVYYAEGKGQASASLLGVTITSDETTLKNNTNFGGFLGVDVPITKAVHINVEGQYSESFSVGALLGFAF
jgi:hypothetical protein